MRLILEHAPRRAKVFRGLLSSFVSGASANPAHKAPRSFGNDSVRRRTEREGPLKLRFLTCLLAALAAPAAADDIESALASGICPTAKIDDRGLPDLVSCKVYEPDWFKASACQDEAIHRWNRILKYNKLYEGCHAGDSAGANPPPEDNISRRLATATPRLEDAGEKVRRQRGDFDRDAASPERREQVKAVFREQQRRNDEAMEQFGKMLLAGKEAKERREAEVAAAQRQQAKEDAARRAEQDRQNALAKCGTDYEDEKSACPQVTFSRAWRDGIRTVVSQGDGVPCRNQADKRFRACKAAYQKEDDRLTEALEGCQVAYDSGRATCTGNTKAFWQEHFVAAWIELEGRTCLDAASAQKEFCEAKARHEQQSTIDVLARASSFSVNRHERIYKSYGDWVPQEVDSDPGPSYVPSFGPTYQGQSPQMQPAPNGPRQTVTPAPQRPSGGDSTTTSNYRGGGGSARYVPPPQPRFVSPGAVR
ncbi:hypothetical protein SAMN05216330_1359 [Bradyrhizobium sp. Ghvi]|uniref:hypothetical protein n=1 Tax=Bradyrhizobium sp. Ghvi TaxID=1855319 RepID=UPI0008DF34F6|nr:hypothetical protein [Bradyrhizobium sp. Ghvi]SFQ37057.1 hypothetical protein SAMN05216330_1359 [Bradyrhizobium sp. Ghvi]